MIINESVFDNFSFSMITIVNFASETRKLLNNETV